MSRYLASPAGRCLVSFTIAILATSALAKDVDSSPVVPAVARFAYVTTESSDNVFGFSVDSSTGRLTPVPGSPFAGGNGPIVTDPKGRFVYTAGQIGNFSIAGYSIDRTTGSLTPVPGSPFQAPFPMPTSLAITPGGRHIYAATLYGQSIVGYAIDQTSGALTPIAGSPFIDRQLPVWLTVHPDGKLLYVTQNLDNSIGAWKIDSATGVLVRIKGSPFPTQVFGPGPITIDSTGAFLYSAGTNAHNSPETSGFSVRQSTGALKLLSGSPFATPGYSLVIDSSDNFAYAIDVGAKMALLRYHPVTGELALLKESAFEPAWLALDPSNKYLYMTDLRRGVYVFTMSNRTGGLKVVSRSPFPPGQQPAAIAVTQ
jgi:6-phosphogluconolactonase